MISECIKMQGVARLAAPSPREMIKSVVMEENAALKVQREIEMRNEVGPSRRGGCVLQRCRGRVIAS